MSPKSGVALSSFIISALTSLLAWAFFAPVELGMIVLLFLCVFVLSLLVIFLFTKYFLSNRLLPIYRTMFGMNPKELSRKMNTMGDPLSDAERDVSEWEDQRKEEIKDLKEREDYRKEFLGNLAHELKTPLFNIQGYVNSLLEGAMDDERVREKFLDKASRNVDRMSRIIGDLDTISHLEYDRLVLERSRIDIVQSAQEVIENLDNKAADKKIRLILKEKNPIYVMADEFRLSQVFTNLINNAIVYGRDNGEVEVSFTDLPEHILVEVRDNGPGIEASKLPRIFERFYRVDKSRARNVGGSGLGLAIVKHILEAHGQSIRAKSTVGTGSIFSFTLDKAK